eukprot:4558227-Karenia_brevis.AAC.1
MAMLCSNPKARELWCDGNAIMEEMRKEGRHIRFRETIARQIIANVSLVQRYLDGELQKNWAEESAAERRRPLATFSIQWKWE